MNSIFIRRSIRKYKDKPIEKEKMELLLKAAMQAPSAVNQQPWEFIVVEGKEKLNELSQMSPYSKMLSECAAAIVLLSNENRMKYADIWQQDMGAAAENILLEAVELDLGGVWLGVAPLEERMKFIKQVFSLPDNIKPFAVIALGYPEGQENKHVDRFDSTRVHYEIYK